MTRLERALGIYNDLSFRQALASEDHYEEAVLRYGMKRMGYPKYLWAAAWSMAREQEAQLRAQENDGPWEHII